MDFSPELSTAVDNSGEKVGNKKGGLGAAGWKGIEDAK
jgi:hypothetical protein